MTIAETILARAAQKDYVSPGEFITADIDKVMCHEAFAAVYMNLVAAGVTKVWDPERVFIFLDHYVPASTQRAATIHQLVRDGAKQYGIKHVYRQDCGVAHQVMLESGNVMPGELILGTDSHTCMYGALGAAACGIGFSEMTYVLATGRLWFKVPETIRFLLSGTLMFPLTSKDVILKIAGDYTAEIAQYKSVEFAGPGAGSLSIASRMTMTNMSVEIGAKFGFFEVDDKTRAYLDERTDTKHKYRATNGSGEVQQTFEIDLSSMEPQVAKPHSVDNVAPVAQLKHVEIHQAVVGSCTNGRLEDLRLAAKMIQGHKVHPDVRLLVIPASKEVYRNAMDDGTLAILSDAGGMILNSGCGPCFGAHMGLLAPGERCISSTNRNFKGRMGSDQAEVYLASPATVIASAVAGRITDPRDL
ncbi:MAG TPA: 3-isopropylmalate dehydratase large subunit [Syntrophorhabdaceae bacterium]|nr:3-isopropylmalate dehydratase large subunit [Syntrophorhabdaceae bacterium]HPA07259.1 3-isopropylmalate dehydratase large subunit [Methanoregulaceae archaeon]